MDPDSSWEWLGFVRFDSVAVCESAPSCLYEHDQGGKALG